MTLKKTKHCHEMTLKGTDFDFDPIFWTAFFSGESVFDHPETWFGLKTGKKRHINF